MARSGDIFRSRVSARSNSAASLTRVAKSCYPSDSYVRFARFAIARAAIVLFGVRLKKGAELIAKLWSMSADQRKDWLNDVLAQRQVVAGDRAIRSLGDLERAPNLSKATLRRVTRSIKVERGTVKRQTAGTTGDPTIIHLSKTELARMLWVRDYCLSQCGVRLGDREGRLWGRPQSGLSNRLKNWFMNRKVFYPSGPGAVEAVRQLSAYKPDYVYGYASLIYEAAKIIEKHGITPPAVKCVICTAESILPSQKEFISRQFNAPVREEYGSTEFDVIAFECSQGHMHLVNPWLIVSSRGDEALISDISRTTIDLINYELGDSLRTQHSTCQRLGSEEVIVSIGGRSMDRYAWAAQDEKFHAVEFAHAINDYALEHSDVLGFSVVQVDFGRFLLEVDQAPKLGFDELGHWVEQYVQDKVGYSIEIHTRLRDSHPQEQSGKKSYFTPMTLSEST